jgi:hypothetical protein
VFKVQNRDLEFSFSADSNRRHILDHVQKAFHGRAEEAAA